jgi:hypothetical protein
VTDVFLTRTVAGLSAADDEARDVLRKWKVGATLRAKIVKPRNIHHHRKFFAMLNTAWQACGKYKSLDSMLHELKRNIGHTEEVVLASTGEVWVIPRSISFSTMDQAEFDGFYERALHELCDMVCEGADDDSLRQTVLEQLQAA